MRKILKRGLVAVLTLAMAIPAISSATNNQQQVYAADEWITVWSDEFNGTSLDESIWNYEIGTGNWGWGNNEQQYYRKENLTVSGGTMKITAKKENYGGKSYTSSRITTQGKKDFKYGRIEARMKLPSFTGSWPAFWMLGANFQQVGWPKCGEIDIMEAINTENFTHGALHWFVEQNNAGGDTGDSSSGKTPAGYNRTDWHTYGIEWDENTIKWYVDDKVFLTQGISADHMSEFRKNQYIIFNLAIGGEWPGYDIDQTVWSNTSKTTLEVDWVRVYSKNEVPTTKYDGPTVEVSEDAVASYNGNWNSWVSGPNSGWIKADATVTANGSKASDGFTVNANNVGTIGGDSVWTIQGQLLNLHFYPGSTYTYKCTLLSNVDKRVYVKVTNSAEESLAGGYIDLKANVPYNYSTSLTLKEDYDDSISLKFGFGKTDGDTIADNGSAKIVVSNVSFVTKTKIPDPSYQVPTTTKAPTTTKVPTTTKAPTTTTTTTSGNVETPVIKKVIPAKVSIKKIKRAKTNRKATITFRKAKNAHFYQVSYSTNKRFKKAKKRKTYSLRYVIKSLKANKKYYVKVRAVRYDDDGKTVYGKWSNRKVVKVVK